MPRRRGRGKKDEKDETEPEPEKPAEGEANQEGEEQQPETPQVPCPHGSHDGQVCCALECHVADVPGKIEALIRQHKAEIDASVEFRATFKGAAISEKGELKVTLIPSISDPFVFARDKFLPHQGRTATVRLEFAAEEPAATGPLTGQQALGFDGPQKPEPEDKIVCAHCHRIARGEGEEPGRICGFCAEGELIFASVMPLYCSECKQPQELTTATAGDMCTLCTQGRYLMGGAPVVESCSDLIRFIPPSRASELTDAVCGLLLQNDCQAKAVVTIGADRFVISEIASSDPITFEAWRAVPMDEHEGDYAEKPDGTNLDHLRVTLPDVDGVPGAAFVLIGPALRVIVKAEEGAEPESEEGDEPTEGEAD